MEIRSHEVWGGREGLEEEHERKREAREKTREKKYAKEIKGWSSKHYIWAKQTLSCMIELVPLKDIFMHLPCFLIRIINKHLVCI